jgi:hypothetical protein
VFLLSLSFLLINCERGLEKVHEVDVSDQEKIKQIKYAGFRSSWYGIDYDFTNEQWEKMSYNMTSFFPGNPQPVHVWIVGALATPGICDLEFEQPGSQTYEKITFTPNKNLDHEKILSYFNTKGIKVYLQVEPGQADISTLIDLIFTQYKHHECVVGFGVDVEWLNSIDSDDINGEARYDQVTDALASQWEQKVKSHNISYKLFLKHWKTRNIMPPTYRGDIVFINDSQGFSDGLSQMAGEFKAWANHFSPNTVMYQIGYGSDYDWWKDEINPPKTMGEQIAIAAYDPDQEIGIVWVDFTLDPDGYPELSELFKGIGF